MACCRLWACRLPTTLCRLTLLGILVFYSLTFAGYEASSLQISPWPRQWSSAQPSTNITAEAEGPEAADPMARQGLSSSEGLADPKPSTTAEGHSPTPHGQRGRQAKKVFLDAVIFARVVKSAKRDVDLSCWVRWALYAGVEAVYLFDTSGTFAESDGQALDLPGISALVEAGVLTVERRKVPNWQKSLQLAMRYQLDFYAEVQRRYPDSTWRMFLDYDEFVFSPNGSERGFLRKYLQGLPPEVAVVKLQNFIFGGIDLKDQQPNISSKSTARALRYLWRAPDKDAKSNRLTKYLARMKSTCKLDVHTAIPCPGHHVLRADPSTLRFNHYWGGRVAKANARKYYVEDRSMKAPFEKMLASTGRDVT